MLLRHFKFQSDWKTLLPSNLPRSFAELMRHLMQNHYSDIIMGTMASQITSLTIVYSTISFRCRSKKTSKLRVTGLCAGNSPVTGEFSAQMATNVENVPIWWRHHVNWLSELHCSMADLLLDSFTGPFVGDIQHSVEKCNDHHVDGLV